MNITMSRHPSDGAPGSGIELFGSISFTFYPEISLVTPSVGPSERATLVSVVGVAFVPGSERYVCTWSSEAGDVVLAANASAKSPTLLECTTPVWSHARQLGMRFQVTQDGVPVRDDMPLFFDFVTVVFSVSPTEGVASGTSSLLFMKDFVCLGSDDFLCDL